MSQESDRAHLLEGSLPEFKELEIALVQSDAAREEKKTLKVEDLFADYFASHSIGNPGASADAKLVIFLNTTLGNKFYKFVDHFSQVYKSTTGRENMNNSIRKRQFL